MPNIYFPQDEMIASWEHNYGPEFRKVRSAMQGVFGTPDGRLALQAVMTALKMFREAVTEEDKILQNAGKRILYIMGSGTEKDTVEAWLNIAAKTAMKGGAKK